MLTMIHRDACGQGSEYEYSTTDARPPGVVLGKGHESSCKMACSDGNEVHTLYICQSMS